MRTLSIAATLLLTTATVTQAQAPLTFDQAAAQALAQNPSIHAAQATADSAAAGGSEAKSAWYPRVSFSEAIHWGNQPVFAFSSLLSAQRFTAANFAIETLNHPNSLTFYQRTFGIDQMLLDFGRTSAASKTAGYRRDIADAAVRQTAASIVVAVADAYGRVLTANASVRAAETAVTTAEEDSARAEHRRDTGTASDADVLSMHAHLSSMRQRAIQSSAEATIARAELNRLMGAPIDASFSVVEPMPPPADTTSTADLLALAASNRPELAMALATERVADAEAGAARAGWLPQVAARAMAEQDGLSFGDRASSWLAGVELRWSVSLGGGEGARTRAASANLVRARAEADSVKAGVDVDVITALARVQSARARIDASGAAVEQARESQRIIRNRYDAGLAAVTDVLRASTALLDAEGARVSAVADALSAAAALDRAVGRSSLSSR